VSVDIDNSDSSSLSCLSGTLPTEEVLEESSSSRPLVMLDDRVVDLTDFLQKHPGGPAVLLANLGRDVSADFHHVTAHHRPGVALKIRQLVVADVDSVLLPAEWAPVGELLDYTRLVRNSFEVQLNFERDPIHDLVYVGQSYRNLLDDHIRAFLGGFSALAGRDVDPVWLRRLGELSVEIEARIEDVLVSLDPILAASMSRQTRQCCVALLDDLLTCGAAAVRALRQHGPEMTTPIPYAGDALLVLTKWISWRNDGCRSDK